MHSIRNILQISPMLLVAWFVPMGLGGVLLATVGGIFLHLIHGNILMYARPQLWWTVI